MYPLKKILIFIFIISFGKIQAQISKKEKDILLSDIPSQNNIQKIKSYDKLFKYYTANYSDSAEYYADKMLSTAQKSNKPKFTALSYFNLGTFYFKDSQFLKAEEYFQKAVKIQEEQELYKDLALTYKNLARVYYYNNNLSKSTDYTMKSLKIYEKINDRQGITDTYINLGTLHSASGNYKKALQYYFSVLKNKDSISTKTKLKLYHNIGSQYKRLNKADSALLYYKKSLAISSKANLRNETATSYFDIGDIYGYYKNKKDSALFYLNKALNILGKNNLNLQKAIYAAVGKTYFENKEYKKSIAPLKKSLEIAEKLQNLNGKEIANYFLYQAYKKMGKTGKSLFHMEKYIQAKDSVKYNEAEIKLENLQSKYENEKNKLKIEKLEQKQKSDKKIQNLLILAIILLVLVFALIIRSFLLSRKKNILKQELLKTEKEKINQDLQFKTKELTSQALMMLQKNKLLDEILQNVSEIKTEDKETKQKLIQLKRKLRYTMNSEKDWELFRKYFEQINKNFFTRLTQINDKITASELKLAALIKLRFNIKESASLLNISAGSIKTSRYNLRKKLNLERNDNLYDFLNKI